MIPKAGRFASDMKNEFNINYLALIIALLGVAPALAQNAETAPPPKGRIWGYSFGDLIYKAQGDTLDWGKTEYAGVEKQTVGANLRRLFLGYDYKITDHFTAKVLVEGAAKTTTPDGRFSLAIITGYLEWNDVLPFIPNSSAKIGLIPTPLLPFPEKSWGYRSVEKEALDLRGLGKVVDQGASLSGDFNNHKSAGFTLMVSNGTGNKPGIDKYLEYQGALYKKFWKNQITLEIMGDYTRKNGDLRQAFLRGFFSVERPAWTFGAELAKVYVQEPVSGAVTDVNPFAVSVFFSNRLPVLGDNWRSFFRYDFYNPVTRYDAEGIYGSPAQHYNEHTFWVGLHYKLKDRINIMPNIIVNHYEGKNDRVAGRIRDIVPRVTVYFVFGD